MRPRSVLSRFIANNRNFCAKYFLCEASVHILNFAATCRFVEMPLWRNVPATKYLASKSPATKWRRMVPVGKHVIRGAYTILSTHSSMWGGITQLYRSIFPCVSICLTIVSPQIGRLFEGRFNGLCFEIEFRSGLVPVIILAKREVQSSEPARFSEARARSRVPLLMPARACSRLFFWPCRAQSSWKGRPGVFQRRLCAPKL